MKKRNLLLLLIPILLVSIFSFNLFAEEEDPESELGVVPPLNFGTQYALDNYFYNNYVLLPYIQSDSHQVINTGINGSNNLKVSIEFSDLVNDSGEPALFGSRSSYGSNQYYISYKVSNDHILMGFHNSNNNAYVYSLDNYRIYQIDYDQNKVYVDGSLAHTFTDSTFNNGLPIYILGLNNNSSNTDLASYKLYSFSIYDYSLSDPNDLESDPVGYVRYYYPARSKSGNIVGLYDAINKTFVTTLTNTPISNPTGSNAELSITAGITATLLAGIGWIGQILSFAKSNAVILIFLAIGLAGAMFRWGRKLVHF